MEKRRRRRGPGIMSEVLTLRMTPEEMLRFRLAALSLGRKRAQIVRERVADLIRPVTTPPTPNAAARAEPAAPEPGGAPARDTVIDGAAAGGTMAGGKADPTGHAGAVPLQAASG